MGMMTRNMLAILTLYMGMMQDILFLGQYLGILAMFKFDLNRQSSMVGPKKNARENCWNGRILGHLLVHVYTYITGWWL